MKKFGYFFKKTERSYKLFYWVATLLIGNIWRHWHFSILFSSLPQNHHGKLGHRSVYFGTILVYLEMCKGLDHIFLGKNQTTDRKMEIEIVWMSWTYVRFHDFFSKCWKFQFSTLKNKNVLFLKKYELNELALIKTTSFVYWPNFQRRFCPALPGSATPT